VGVFVSVGPTGLGKGEFVAVAPPTLVALGAGAVGDSVFVTAAGALNVLAGKAVAAGATVTTSAGKSSGLAGLNGLKKTFGLAKMAAMPRQTTSVKPMTSVESKLYKRAEPFFMFLILCARPARRRP
jgi:hypothetical protein